MKPWYYKIPICESGSNGADTTADLPDQEDCTSVLALATMLRGAAASIADTLYPYLPKKSRTVVHAAQKTRSLARQMQKKAQFSAFSTGGKDWVGQKKKKQAEILKALADNDVFRQSGASSALEQAAKAQEKVLNMQKKAQDISRMVNNHDYLPLMLEMMPQAGELKNILPFLQMMQQQK